MDMLDIICKSIDIIAKKRVDEANFDRTVLATVIEKGLKDNEYYCQYQDSKFLAKTLNGSQFDAGDRVYILYPNNNTSGTADRIILNSKNYYWQTW